MEEKNEMRDLTILMSKIDRAMDMTREKQESINTMNKDLLEETRPMMVEKRKEQIAMQEDAKKEFDEMTKNAMVEAKNTILKLREETEKEYQNKLMETVKISNRIQSKLEKMEGRDP